LSLPPPGGLMAVVVAAALQGKEYHVVAVVEGHELETPKTEQRPRLKRLLETTHLELNGSCSSTRSRPLPGAPTVGVFDPGGSLDRRVKLSLRVPAQMGWHEMEHKGEEHGSCYPAPRGNALAVGVTSVREGEKASLLVSPCSRATTLSYEGPGLSFIDVRRGSRCTMGV
jgi:hypothetical protein